MTEEEKILKINQIQFELSELNIYIPNLFRLEYLIDNKNLLIDFINNSESLTPEQKEYFLNLV